MLSYALPELPGAIDPLAADSRSEQVVVRQLFEPLVASLNGPYGGPAGAPGLATSVEPTSDPAVWRVVLRTGVMFQDGSPLNASAVLANARRWLSSPKGQGLMPGLFAVDAPRPNEVRFIFSGPAEGVREQLASPRLGIVSPQALSPATGERAAFDPQAAGSGTGAFEQAGRADDRLELTRNADWWGSAAGLGPALDAVAFVPVPSEPDRLELLRSGGAQVAEPFGPASLAAIASEPLLRARSAGTGSGASGIGLEASVRGIDSAAVPVLSGVWLTTIEG